MNKNKHGYIKVHDDQTIVVLVTKLWSAIQGANIQNQMQRLGRSAYVGLHGAWNSLIIIPYYFPVCIWSTCCCLFTTNGFGWLSTSPLYGTFKTFQHCMSIRFHASATVWRASRSKFSEMTSCFPKMSKKSADAFLISGAEDFWWKLFRCFEWKSCQCLGYALCSES